MVRCPFVSNCPRIGYRGSAVPADLPETLGIPAVFPHCGAAEGQDLDFGKDGHMNAKWIGTMIVILGCGGFGFGLAASHRRQVKQIRQLLTVLDLIQSELEYRRTPLPELCRLAGENSTGTVKTLFHNLSLELDKQIAPDAGCCMNAAVSESELSPLVKGLFRDLGRTLGRFDLQGQVRGIDAVRRDADRVLDKLTKDQDNRLQSYQTLGLCAGAALAILLL